jgi:hypothetical protein
MIGAVPFSDVSIIAGVLGMFFLLVAFYKSIFHRRRSPTSLLNPDRVEMDDNQPIHINDPFKPLSPPDSKPETPEPEEAPHVTAFRQFTPRKNGEIPMPKDDAAYVWE